MAATRSAALARSQKSNFYAKLSILTIESTVVLSVREYYGEVFVSHFNAFVINSRGVISAICVDSLADHRTLSVKKNLVPSDNTQYVTMYYY